MDVGATRGLGLIHIYHESARLFLRPRVMTQHTVAQVMRG